MPLRHALVLAINTSLLTVLFAFTTWLYRDSRRAVSAAVSASLSSAAAMTEQLARLRERELSFLAQNLASSPMLRGAVATGDRETIEDVLTSISGKTRGAVVLAKGDGVTHAGSDLLRTSALSELERGRLLGRAALEPGARTLLAIENPSPELLEDWSRITSVRYALRTPPAVHNLPAADQELASQTALGDSVLAAANRYYARQVSILDGRLTLTLFAPHDPFWSGFKARRDSLVVLGGALFFLGLCLSLFFAWLLERHASTSAGTNADWLGIIQEIETAKAKKTPAP